MPEVKANRWDTAGKWALRWLIVPPLVYVTAALLLTAVLASRDCQDARVVLAGDLPDSMPVTLLAWHNRGIFSNKQRDIVGTAELWRGPLGKGPILIPFAVPFTGAFEVKVEDPTGPARSKKFGNIWSMGDTHYIFIGRKEIIHSVAQTGLLRDPTGEPSPFREALRFIATVISDKLSCADRWLPTLIASRSIR